MKQTTEIIFTNLFSQLRNEFFGEENTLVALSPYKQHKLDTLRKHIDNVGEYSAAEVYSFESQHQERWRRKVVEEERHAIDTSVETLDFRNILIYNISLIERGTPSVHGIISMGLYLRQKGHLVDFVKFEAWIHRLRISGMVSLLSSLLLQLFNFEPDELPYRYKVHGKAYMWLYAQIADMRRPTAYRRTRSMALFSPLATLAVWKKAAQTALDNIEE